MFIAICEDTADRIYSVGETALEANKLLWEKVHTYLVERNAPRTQDFNAEQLSDFFGSQIIDTSIKGAFFL